MPAATTFHEANLSSTPIRDLHLTIAGTPLEPVVQEFERTPSQRIMKHKLSRRTDDAWDAEVHKA